MISLGKANDLNEIVALTKACGKHMRDNGIDQWDENYPDVDGLLNDLKSETLFAYRLEGAIIGIVVLNELQDEEYAEINWSTRDSDKNLVVHRLAVHPNHQGQGIARKLMDFSEEWAIQHSYVSIRLDTFSQNPRNQRFYLNRGYTDMGKVYLKYKKDFPYYCYELLLTTS